MLINHSVTSLTNSSIRQNRQRHIQVSQRSFLGEKLFQEYVDKMDEYAHQGVDCADSNIGFVSRLTFEHGISRLIHLVIESQGDTNSFICDLMRSSHENSLRVRDATTSPPPIGAAPSIAYFTFLSFNLEDSFPFSNALMDSARTRRFSVTTSCQTCLVSDVLPMFSRRQKIDVCAWRVCFRRG